MNGPDTSLAVLVAGGAGYIGSVTAAALIEAGHRVTVLDDISRGYTAAVHPDARLVAGDISNRRAVAEACRGGIDVAMHFAAFIEVGESVADPGKYYGNNLSKTVRFLDLLRGCGVGRLVFSSTAAVYGDPLRTPVTEEDPLLPVNPYGWTKRMIEQALEDYDRAYGFRSIRLRYFNAGGAFGPYGEDHRPESHLIPRILDAASRGATVDVYGADYPTRDGSCIRDYIHVRDLAEAHILAARNLAHGDAGGAFNLGSGRGFTVLEVIAAAEAAIGKTIRKRIASRRPGDAPALVASSEKARSGLGWRSDPAGLEAIIASAWEWRKRHPDGYGGRHA